MFKRFPLFFLMVFTFCNLTLAIDNLTYSQNLQQGQLNEIKVNTDNTFKADILGNGTEQNFAIKKAGDRHSDGYDVTISQQSKTLGVFKVLGNEFGYGKWYLAYLRNNDIPDIIYFVVGGMKAHLTDFKIVGKGKDGNIDVLFDLTDKNTESFFLSNGTFGSRLSIKGTQLIITNFSGQFIIDWDGDKFNVAYY